jgi:hypothetical protein
VVSRSETISLLLVTGQAVEVEGPLDDVATQLENASRSSAGTLAWFVDAHTDRRLGINPSHVVSIHCPRV